MRILRSFPVLDALDIDVEAEFWAAVLGGEAKNVDSDEFGRWRDVVVDGQVRLSVQHAPGLVPPRWPAESAADQQQQIHLDLHVAHAEVPAAREEVLALGARMLKEAPDPGADRGFHVFADPAGHPFCICWG